MEYDTLWMANWHRFHSHSLKYEILMIFFCFSFDSAVHRPLDIKNRPRIPIPDEDPYSIAGNGGGSGSSGSSGFGNSNNTPGWYPFKILQIKTKHHLMKISIRRKY